MGSQTNVYKSNWISHHKCPDFQVIVYDLEFSQEFFQGVLIFFFVQRSLTANLFIYLLEQRIYFQVEMFEPFVNFEVVYFILTW